MEPESSASRAQRLARRRRDIVAESAIAAAFLGGVFFADRVHDGAAASTALRFAVTLPPVLVLAIWMAFYVAQIRRRDELERIIEMRSLALAGGATVMIATAWGLFSMFVDAPALPLVFVAPLAAAIYAAIRAVVSFGFK